MEETDRRRHVPQQAPAYARKPFVILHLARPAAAPKTFVFVFDQQLADGRLAHARHGCGVGEQRFILEYVGKGRITIGSFERRRRKLDFSLRLRNAETTHDHLEYQNTKSPPVDRARMSTSFDHFRRDVFSTSVGAWRQTDDTPSVPTNEFVRKSAMHERVSTRIV